MIDKNRIGSSFDKFLDDEKLTQEAEEVAKRRINLYLKEQQKEDKNTSY